MQFKNKVYFAAIFDLEKNVGYNLFFNVVIFTLQFKKNKKQNSRKNINEITTLFIPSHNLQNLIKGSEIG